MSWRDVIKPTEHREPAPAPEPNHVLAEPATPEACAADYERGAADRAAVGRTARRQHR